MLDLYAARLERGPIGIEDWLRTEYDPEAATTSFREGRAPVRLERASGLDLARLPAPALALARRRGGR